MTIAGVASQLVQLVVALALAPLLVGWVNQCRAWLQNKRAPSMLLPYYTIAAAQHIAPNTTYGVRRNSGEAFSATTASDT